MLERMSQVGLDTFGILRFRVYHKVCMKEGIETTPGNIEKIYIAMVEISDALNKKLPICTKSIDDVKLF